MTAAAATCVDLSVKLGSLRLKNPVTVASGTFGYGTEYAHVFDSTLLGGVFLKALTMNPRPGNPPNRICETSSGMLNSIGLQNVGIDRFFSEKEPNCQRIASAGVTIFANLAGQTIEEFEQLIDHLETTTAVHAYELNVSCPNVNKGGCQFGQDQTLLRELVIATRKLTQRPIIVKLSPQVTDIAAMGVLCERAGADALSLINTFPAMAIDAQSRRPVLNTIAGGLSGPAIKPIALRMVYQTAQAVSIPIIGMGGIMNATDAIEFLLAGASAISSGTANFVNPNAPVEILRGLEAYCIEHCVDRVEQLIGGLQV